MENLPDDFSGDVQLENRYYFTNTDKCSFEVTLKKIILLPGYDKEEKMTYKIASPSINPWGRGNINLNLPDGWMNYTILELKCTDLYGREIMKWTYPVGSPAHFNEMLIVKKDNNRVVLTENSTGIILSSGGIKIFLGKTTGLLDSVGINDKIISFGNGPVLQNMNSKFLKFISSEGNDNIKVSSIFESGLISLNWTMFPGGLVEMDYEYMSKGKLPFAGISFSLPEKFIRSVTMLADGPYRVWKNRMKGPMFGLWDKDFNNTVTGESWLYPEFKGYYSRFYGAVFQTTLGQFRILTSTDDMFLRLYTPQRPSGATNNNTSPEFPSGDISFLHAINAIGMKFAAPVQLGPESELNNFAGRRLIKKGTLYFDFRK